MNDVGALAHAQEVHSEVDDMDQQQDFVAERNALTRQSRGVTRRSVTGSVLLGGAAFLAACGTGNSSAPRNEASGAAGAPQGAASNRTAEPPVPSFAGKNIVVEYWEQISGPEGEGRDKALSAFNGAVPGVTLNITNIVGQGGLTKVQSAAAAGSGPDIMFLTWPDASTLTGTELIVPVEDRLRPFREWDKRKADVGQGILKAHVWKGKLMSVPIYGGTFATYYNKSLLNKRGLPEPKPGWTWDDFSASASKLADGDQQFGYSITDGGGVGTAVYWWAWAGSNNATFLNADGTKTTVTAPEVAEATQFLVDLGKRKVMSVSRAAGGPQGEFAQHKAGYEVNGAYRIPVWQQASIDFGLIGNPVKKKKHTYVAAHHAVLFNTGNADKVSASARFLSWALEPKQHIAICRQASTVPVYGEALKSADNEAYVKEFPELKIFQEYVPTSEALPMLPTASEFYGTFGNHIARALRGEAEVGRALADAQAEMQLALEKALQMGK
ncbi:MAG TPA: extracellular solute-binding protein [Chloroflexota bacterium]|nr:extracellular solute-binding protein [Chloroflexota bacterium]